MRDMTSEEKNELKYEIIEIMKSSVSSEYAIYILEHENEKTGTTLMDDIIENVLTTSGWNDNQEYSDSDIRFAIGRELMNRLKIKY